MSKTGEANMAHNPWKADGSVEPNVDIDALLDSTLVPDEDLTLILTRELGETISNRLKDVTNTGDLVLIASKALGIVQSSFVDALPIPRRERENLLKAIHKTAIHLLD